MADAAEALRNLYNKQLGSIDVRELEAGIATAISGGQVSKTSIKHAEAILSNAKKKMAIEGRSKERNEAEQALTQAVKEASKRNLATLTKLEVATLRAAVEKAEDFFVRAEETVKGWALLNDVEAAQQGPKIADAQLARMAARTAVEKQDLSLSAPAQLQGIPAPSTPQPKQTIYNQVKAWIHGAFTKVSETPDALHRRFLADEKSIKFEYGSVVEFYAGLEGMLGSPSVNVMHAMEKEHSSKEPFKASNANVLRVTTPLAEWAYVAKAKVGEEVTEVKDVSMVVTDDEIDAHGNKKSVEKILEKHPSHTADLAGPRSQVMGQGDNGRVGWTLDDFCRQDEPQRAGLMREEVAGLRLYTGAMYVPYQAVLRGLRTLSDYLRDTMLNLCCPKDIFDEYKAGKITLDEAMQSLNRYTTTLHAINSGIVKLSKFTKATTVYRGVSGVLPEAFWLENEHGVKGGIELGFMSTTTNRATAVQYMNQEKKTARMIFEIKMGMVDRGADLGWASQYDEKEILFAPLTGLEPQSVRVENGILVVELRLSCNLHDQTLEQVVGRMKTSHVAFINTMMDNLRLGIQGLPPTVLIPLEEAKAQAEAHDHTYFNNPKQHTVAFIRALEANDACYAKLVVDDTWAAAKGDGTAVAGCMRKAAEKCANEERPKQAAALLVMAVEQADVAAKHQAKVAQLLSTNRQSAVAVRPVLEATSMLLAEHGSDGQWKPTLVELCVLAGDRHIVGRLCQMHGLREGDLWAIQPAPMYPDLQLDGYKAQPYFHQINTNTPGTQLISDNPYIFVIQDFFSAEECKEVVSLYAHSSDKGSSATFEEQTKDRTSKSVIWPIGSEPPLLSKLRERVATLARVGTDQLQATKLSCYERGEFFRKHTDAVLQAPKYPWVQRLMAGNETAEELTAEGEACFLPDRYCTVWVYLNDTERGGHSCFHTRGPSNGPSDTLYEAHLPEVCKVLGTDVPTARPLRDTPLIQPKAGMAVLHFPTTNQKHMCLLDGLTRHEGHAAVDPKYIMQQFIWSEPLETVVKKQVHFAASVPALAGKLTDGAVRATLFGAPA